ncbi:probable serine/threonine-protein kinase At1g54610 isoform X2 [Zingiber officinale]|uniref:probable serine/threonine-protein kinase At1g54610 isoform X2 n=1 Tax=Zingiber officinale TaxID=94328 RepID=UPI001C4C0F6D|nr:probable serine/threonine-protein kinase At1g54610 isoform X2 [Zingiber officinale]
MAACVTAVGEGICQTATIYCGGSISLQVAATTCRGTTSRPRCRRPPMGCLLSKRSAAAPSAPAEKAPPTWPSERPCIPPALSPPDPSTWPIWLLAVAGESLRGWNPRRADSFRKVAKIGSGTYSNVYKARDLETGRMVAMKKVRFDLAEPESVRFMAREITVLRRLDHPNVVRLEGIAISRVSSALYLVFEYMEHDLAGLAAAPGVHFTEPQVKCYMKQLLSGLEHCHSRGVLHRDIKGSNLLLDNEGTLKIADFGLASTFDPSRKARMTSRVVTLWYRAPELILGATNYGVGIDLWSAGCILAELFMGKPVLPGRTEVEQLHRIFKLCGSPSEKYWKKSKLRHTTIVRPKQHYTCCIRETFKEFPPSSLSLIDSLLSLDPDDRGTATTALNHEFFTTEPCACDPSSLPQYPPSKEMDAKLREKARRQSTVCRKGYSEASRRSSVRNCHSRAVPAPEANAELQVNLERMRLMTHINVTSKSEKFPPPHQDGSVGIPLDGPMSFVAPDTSFTSSVFEAKEYSSGGLVTSEGTQKRNISKEEPRGLKRFMEIKRNRRVHGDRRKELEVLSK